MNEYAALQHALVRLESSIHPAELHGVLCGLLCSPQLPAEEQWMNAVLAEVEPEPDLRPECRQLLQRCGEQAAARLGSVGFAFAPLLPDDEQPLQERADALASWCGGLLFGLGLGGLSEHSPLSPEAREVLVDVGEFTRMEPDPEDGEADERAFAELVEYVRIGVLMLHGELTAGRAGAGPLTTVH